MGMQSLCSSGTNPSVELDNHIIEYNGQRFVVPEKIKFDRQSTIQKIETAASAFCVQNNINLFYMPTICRMIAFNHQDMFLKIWYKFKQEDKEHFLEELNAINHDLVDSLYHHFVQENAQNHQKKSLKSNILKINIPPCFMPTYDIQQKTLRWQGIGKKLLSRNKVAVVLMCAGSSSRFQNQDKFLSPINLFEKVTILDLMFYRLKKNVGSNLLNIIINCNQNNMEQVKRYVKNKKYYGYEPNKIFFLFSYSLPVFDVKGQFLFNEKLKMIKHSSGTLNCAEELFSDGRIYEKLMKERVEYIYFSGAQNLMQNPCDPVFLGAMIENNHKGGIKCVDQLYLNEHLPRFYEYEKMIHFLNLNNFDSVHRNKVDQLPIPINSLVIQLSTLNTIIKDYSSKILLAKNYQIITRQQKIFDLQNNKISLTTCYSFEKDIKYIMTCFPDPLLYKVNRTQSFVRICSKNKEHSFDSAINHYHSLLQKELYSFYQ